MREREGGGENDFFLLYIFDLILLIECGMCMCVVALGEYEPFFCRMALYDAKKKMKLTDDFHLDVNSDAVRFFMRGMVLFVDILFSMCCLLVLSHFEFYLFF